MKGPLKGRASVAVRFRGEIERLAAEGVGREDMLLRLTLGDVTQLKRDGSLAVADISFAGGTMRFLGVRIEPGGIAQSVLERSPPDPSPAA